MAWTERSSPEGGTALHGVFQFADFAEAFAFLTRVALVAQERQHHPDMAISWNRVTITLTTHDAGSTVTDRDRELGEIITRLDAAR
jgi:4a-hydroxytetrahydrobiopterin dehydratase